MPENWKKKPSPEIFIDPFSPEKKDASIFEIRLPNRQQRFRRQTLPLIRSG